jgi:hypothetical protein
VSTALLERLPDEILVPLLEDLGEKNTVRVTLRRANQPRAELLHDTSVDPKDLAATRAGLLNYDRLRVSHGLKPLYTQHIYASLGYELRGFAPNLRTDVGTDFCAVQLGAGASATAVAKYIGLTNNTNAASAANTATNTTATRICWGTNASTDAAASTSRGEYTFGGVTRTLATYAHTPAVASFQQSKPFTASTTLTALQAAGLFDTTTQGTGTLVCENLFTSTTLANGDQLTVTWTLNI